MSGTEGRGVSARLTYTPSSSRALSQPKGSTGRPSLRRRKCRYAVLGSSWAVIRRRRSSLPSPHLFPLPRPARRRRGRRRSSQPPPWSVSDRQPAIQRKPLAEDDDAVPRRSGRQDPGRGRRCRSRCGRASFRIPRVRHGAEPLADHTPSAGQRREVPGSASNAMRELPPARSTRAPTAHCRTRARPSPSRQSALSWAPAVPAGSRPGALACARPPPPLPGGRAGGAACSPNERSPDPSRSRSASARASRLSIRYRVMIPGVPRERRDRCPECGEVRSSGCARRAEEHARVARGPRR